MEAIQKLIRREGMTIADFSREIRRRQRIEYLQVYRLIVMKAHEPHAEIMLVFIEWALEHDPSLCRLLNISRNRKRATARN
jgi:hypothetical protein